MISREDLRALVIARRDLSADLYAARLSMIDAEAVGLDTSEAAARIRALEDRDRELSYAQRQVSAAQELEQRHLAISQT